MTHLPPPPSTNRFTRYRYDDQQLNALVRKCRKWQKYGVPELLTREVSLNSEITHPGRFAPYSISFLFTSKTLVHYSF